MEVEGNARSSQLEPPRAVVSPGQRYQLSRDYRLLLLLTSSFLQHLNFVSLLFDRLFFFSLLGLYMPLIWLSSDQLIQ
jgi:hypothetical protein